MVVSVREHSGSVAAMSPGSAGYGGGSMHGGLTPSQASTDIRSNAELPIYDPHDPMPVHRLIIHLVETFFTHLGCNYPFLQQEKFQRMVEEKRVDAILVDAVCSLAARFTDHPLLTISKNPQYPKSDHGHVFARRAKLALVDTFPRPSVAAVQACLLLAYEGFGSNQDSALWMHLGCAIRMAQDLGLNKLQGVKQDSSNNLSSTDEVSILSDPKELERERLDTLWTVFMLDRVISSGTGRPVTLRDEDFEISFPEISPDALVNWPAPFPALIQIVHLYGRVSDLINNIRDVKDVTPEKIQGLAGMESDLTKIYQKLDQRLTFNAANFQHYVKSGEGTNFILVHFWFHTLIMLLHQPTLLHSFEGSIQQLLPNSRELSMSSAKTIADILAFAELIDPKSFIGNPFTSQPMYIAACAFLMESAAHTSQPASRDATPPKKPNSAQPANSRLVKPGSSTHQKQATKHSLLATAANQNYQRCYKALEQLEKYWAGTKYILTALDQKAKGIWDPETYTLEEMESTKAKPDPGFTAQSWKRKITTAVSAQSPKNVWSPKLDIPGSPSIDTSQAIGWSLTGTTNSPSSNLAFLYQFSGDQQHNTAPAHHSAVSTPYYDPIRQSLPEATPPVQAPSFTRMGSSHSSFSAQPGTAPQVMLPPAPKLTADAVSTQDAEMLLNLQGSPYSQATPGSMQHPHTPFDHNASPRHALGHAGNTPHSVHTYDVTAQSETSFPGNGHGYMGLGGVENMMIESQDIDMTALAGDMVPWLEYLPQDAINFFDASTTGDNSDPVNLRPG
jgi:hypothetical protein